MNETDTFSGRRLDFSLTGKVAIITGAGSGIGKAIAQLFVARGARVALVGRSESVREMARSLGEDHAQHFILNVTDFPRIRPTVDEIVAKFGNIDILVNNAGIAFRESAEEASEEKWDLTMAVNLKAAFLLSQAAGRYFMDQGHGKIINIASQAAVVALTNHLAYCTSK
jgi:NAD(P)-dependent dehydrogenase (short-subunit alcohol dehydrogenase family)